MHPSKQASASIRLPLGSLRGDPGISISCGTVSSRLHSCTRDASAWAVAERLDPSGYSQSRPNLQDAGRTRLGVLGCDVCLVAF
jgi:hypothetical protein